MYKDMHRGKKICYNEYLEKMRDKVDEQREQIRKKTQQIENKLKAQEEREVRIKSGNSRNDFLVHSLGLLTVMSMTKWTDPCKLI